MSQILSKTVSFLICFIAVACSERITCKEDVWCLSSTSFPEEIFSPPIGNGHIATNVLSGTIYMNGFYSGIGADSHRARILSTNAIDVLFDDKLEQRVYTLDLYNGIFTQEIQHPENSTNITLTYFAHRKYGPLLITHAQRQQILPENETGRKLEFVYNQNGYNFTDDISNFREKKIDSATRYWSGQNRHPETNLQPHTNYHHFWTTVYKPDFKRSGHEEWIWISSISTNKDEASSSFNMSLELGYDKLLNLHTDEWNKIWKSGRIEVKGNDELSKNINAALYNILSSLPQEQNLNNPFIGLSPGGLSRGGKINPAKIGGPSNDYAGHVFWDMDTWIMPPVMLFHPRLAKIMLESRTRILETAKENAQSTGFKGARFPWEQAVSGKETCPWDLAAKYQIHVTADVSYALRQYIYVTDKNSAQDFLNNNGSSLALEIGRFWESRVTIDDNDTYNIIGVMGPDEYHYNINNSVFTNYNAKLSLALPSWLNERYDIIDKSRISEMSFLENTARNIRILYDDEGKFHPQFEGFSFQDKIKQSDVVLLGFPLLMPMDQEVRRNDLIAYEKTTDEFGPDTGTWSMHTVGWLELQDENKANQMFQMLLRNINGPFKVFSEKPFKSPDGPRCVNFITGAGGLLQAVMFGYGGIRIRDTQLDINPVLFPNVSQWSMNGLDYKGFEFDLIINQTHIRITLYKPSTHSSDLTAITIHNDTVVLRTDHFNDFPRGKLALKETAKEHVAGNSNINNAASLTILFPMYVLYGALEAGLVFICIP